MQLILLPTEPKFVGSAVIPDNDDRGDDKVYFFFTEREMDAEGVTKAVYSRIGRVCAVRILQKQNPTKMFILTVTLKPIHAFISQNDQGGQRMLVNRWTSFLKTRLICSVAGPNGIDTHFDELGKETTKPYKSRYLMIAFFLLLLFILHPSTFTSFRCSSHRVSMSHLLLPLPHKPSHLEGKNVINETS